MSQPGHCGLCNVPSMFLQASQWGQVCRLCLRAKSRKAVRGASVAVQAPVEPQGLREAWNVGVAWSREDEAYIAHRIDQRCVLPHLTTHGESPTEALQELVTALELEENVRAKDATTCWFCDRARNDHEAGCMGEQVDRQAAAHAKALRQEGRQQAVAWLRTQARQELQRAEEHARSGFGDWVIAKMRHAAEVLAEAADRLEKAKHPQPDEEGT